MTKRRFDIADHSEERVMEAIIAIIAKQIALTSEKTVGQIRSEFTSLWADGTLRRVMGEDQNRFTLEYLVDGCWQPITVPLIH